MSVRLTRDDVSGCTDVNELAASASLQKDY
jgi:hypothetical protein